MQKSPHQIPTGSGPQVRTQFSNHAVPEIKSRRAGLEKMGDVLSNFFSQASGALGNIQQTVHEGEQIRIEQENQAQARKGQTDALMGREADPALATDKDYRGARQNVSATRLAAGSIGDFNDYVVNDFQVTNPGGDLREARDLWVQENLTGIEDEKVEALALSQFYEGTEELISQHRVADFNRRTQENKMALQETIGIEIAAGRVSPESIQRWQDDYRSLDPMNPSEAAPFVTNQLITGLTNNPKETTNIIRSLSTPGSGSNGQSLAVSHPEAYASLQAKALSIQMETNSIEEDQAFYSLEKELASNPAHDITSLGGLLNQLWEVRNTYGAESRARPLEAAIWKAMGEFTEQTNIAGAFEKALGSDFNRDPAFLSKAENWETFTTQATGDKSINGFLETEGRLGNIIKDLKSSVPTPLKDQLSDGLTKSANPAHQAKLAQELWLAQKGRGGASLDYLGMYLSDEAARYYTQVQHHMATGMDATQAVERANFALSDDSRRNLKLADFHPDVEPAKVLEKTNTSMANAFNEASKRNQWFDWIGNLDSEDFDPGAAATLKEYQLGILRERPGMTPDDAMKEAVSRYAPRMEILGTGDNPRLIINNAANKPGDLRIPYMGAKVMNPKGEFENIHKRSRADMGNAVEFNPVLFDGLDPDEIAYRPDPSEPGTYDVIKPDGTSVVLDREDLKAIGKLTLNGEEIDLSAIDFDNPEASEDDLPQGFGFDVDPATGDLKLQYVPYFEDARSHADVVRERALQRDQEIKDGLNRDINKVVDMAKAHGYVLPSVGIKPPVPEFASLEEAQSWLTERRQDALKYMGPGRAHSKSKGIMAYPKERADTMAATYGYSDYAISRETGERISKAVGPATAIVGFGFDMTKENARDAWNAAFGDDSGKLFDRVRHGDQKLTRQQAEKLFNSDVQETETFVQELTSEAGASRNQHMALVGFAYRHPELKGEISDAMTLDPEERDAAMAQIFLHSGSPKLNTAEAVERYKSALMYFGGAARSKLPSHTTYLGGDNITSEAVGPKISSASFHADVKQKPEDISRMADGIKRSARSIGIEPWILGTVISYETMGRFDPTIVNPEPTNQGTHKGLIQWGDSQRRDYHIDLENDPIGSQLFETSGGLSAVARYLRDRGVKPGDGLLEVYAAINGGNVSKTEVSDARQGGRPGTVRWKVENDMEGHKAKGRFIVDNY